MKEFNAGKKLRFGGVEIGLTMGKYHYWDEFEDDNTKPVSYTHLTLPPIYSV